MAFNQTILAVQNPIVDPRDQVAIPLMSALEKQRFAKMALQDIPGAHKTFNRVFGGTRKASDYPPVRLVDAGVPAFLWTR